MSGELKQEIQAALRSELYPFFVRAMKNVMPGDGYLHNWHMVVMCAALEQMISGDSKRFVLNIHPRMGKSLLCSVALPMFLLMQDPSLQIMCLSYSDSLAADFHQKCRMIAQQKWYQDLNPALQFKEMGKASLLKASSDILQTSQLGYRLASSIGGSFTGKGADWIIIDDPNDMALIHSEAHRTKINNTFDTAIANRLNNKDGRILVVSQRGHIDDLSGHVLAKGNFEQLKIEAIAREDQTIAMGKGLFHARKKAELIHPERFGQKELDERKIDLGSMAFEAQYQQNPQPPDGNLFKKEWIKFVSKLPEFQYVFITADIAQTSGGGDWSAFIVWGYHDGIWYVLHAHRVQYDMPGVLNYYEVLDKKYEPDFTAIESNGPGKGIAEMLVELKYDHVGMTAVSGSKNVRAMDATPLVEQGVVVFNENMEGRDAFLNELLAFPSSKYDDWVDALTLLLNRRPDMLRMGNTYRRAGRRHLPKAWGTTLRVNYYSLGSSSSGDKYFDRTGVNLFGGKY